MSDEKSWYCPGHGVYPKPPCPYCERDKREQAQTERTEFIYHVGMTQAELNELILLIDDEPVDEEFLRGIRRKLVHKRKLLRQRERKMS